MEDIKNIEQLCGLVKIGFTNWTELGLVNVRQSGDLLIFNYKEEAQYIGKWNFFERISRGLIINKVTGEVVARPFDKFYNWLEGGRSTNAQIVSITEKMDGSLGILYRNNGTHKIATRGNFESDQAIWATRFLEKFDLIHVPNEYTLLFEIIYPQNRIVINYEGRQDLVLLAARNRFTGEYLALNNLKLLANKVGFSLPNVYDFSNVDEVIKLLPVMTANEEGYVVAFSDGQHFKFKSKQYLELHKKISLLSFQNTLQAVIDNKVATVRLELPDEFLLEFEAWVLEINNTVQHLKEASLSAFLQAPKETRKEFVLWVQKNYAHLFAYLMALLDGKDLDATIYKHAFKNRKV